MTGQLSQSMQIWRARDSINAMPATITSESSTSPVEFNMATVCKICVGPIEPPDQHFHWVACLGLAHAEAALDKSDCGHCANPPGPSRYGSRPIRGGAHCRQRAAGGPPLSWWWERRLPIPRFPSPRTASSPLLTSRSSYPLARRRGMTPCPSRPRRGRIGRDRSQEDHQGLQPPIPQTALSAALRETSSQHPIPQ